MEKTNTYSRFTIESKGEIEDEGLVAYDDGIFDPEELTRLLGIKPYKSWKKGDLRINGTQFGFSSWTTGKSDVGRLDVQAQCLETIKLLKDKISTLRQIKQMYNVNFILKIAPQIYGEESPYIYFDEEIIDFCYQTGTTIGVDMCIFSEEDNRE